MKLCRASGVLISHKAFEPSQLDDERPVFKLLCGWAPSGLYHAFFAVAFSDFSEAYFLILRRLEK